MFMKYILTFFLTILFTNDSANASHHHDSESNKPSGDGHCMYMADNPFAGDPYKACRTNVSENFCEAFSEVWIGFETHDLVKSSCKWSGPLSYVATDVSTHSPVLHISQCVISL